MKMMPIFESILRENSGKINTWKDLWKAAKELNIDKSKIYWSDQRQNISFYEFIIWQVTNELDKAWPDEITTEQVFAKSNIPIKVYPIFHHSKMSGQSVSRVATWDEFIDGFRKYSGNKSDLGSLKLSTNKGSTIYTKDTNDYDDWAT